MVARKGVLGSLVTGAVALCLLAVAHVVGTVAGGRLPDFTDVAGEMNAGFKPQSFHLAFQLFSLLPFA